MLGIRVFVLAFLALTLQVSAAHKETEYCDRCPETSLNDLRVTWRPDKSSPGAFDKLPRTECEAEEMGFRKLKCECCSGTTFGIGYVKDNDTHLVMLFDKQGTICGVQAQFLKKDLDKNKKYYRIDEIGGFQCTEYEGEEYYTLTAYFIDPKKICSEGRSEEELEEDGTVQQLYFQIGDDPECDVIALPFNEKGLEGTTWVKGACRQGMGSHYKKDYCINFDCAHFLPIVPMYDEHGCLIGCTLGTFGCFYSSDRFEHVRDNYLKIGFPHPLAPCLCKTVKATGGTTTIHVYFIDKPWEVSCCS